MKKDQKAKKDGQPVNIKAEIARLLENNYQNLKLNGGHALTESVKRSALNQVWMYYEKMSKVANNVKKTEVKLTLPDRVTSKGKRFSIEGVVDIIQEGVELAMYDIKTHDKDYIVMYKEMYSEQLNLYGHVYESLNNEKLDKTAIISTNFPKNLILEFDEINQKVYDEWDPEIILPYTRKSIEKTVSAFSEVVDKIESKKFQPAPLKILKEKPTEKGIPTFAIRVCRNCDARYTCGSYLNYAEEKRERSMDQGFFQIFLADEDRERYLDLVNFDEPSDIDEPDIYD